MTENHRKFTVTRSCVPPKADPYWVEVSVTWNIAHENGGYRVWVSEITYRSFDGWLKPSDLRHVRIGDAVEATRLMALDWFGEWQDANPTPPRYA